MRCFVWWMEGCDSLTAGTQTHRHTAQDTTKRDETGEEESRACVRAWWIWPLMRLSRIKSTSRASTSASVRRNS